MTDDFPAVVSAEDSDGLSDSPCDYLKAAASEAAKTGCSYATEADAILNDPNHTHKPGMAESRRPLGVAGREGLLSVIEDLDGLIKSSQHASTAFRESEGRLAVVEIDMCRGYQRARAALRNILKADVAQSARIAEKSRPCADVDCVRDLQ